MKVLDIFSGIGGFSLGLERAGMETIAFCEIEEYPKKVLKKNWPKIPIASDVTKLNYREGVLYDDGREIYRGSIDAICGGFPCQDLSNAGKKAGIEEGTRSGLWSECARLLGEIRPRYAIFENVSALLSGDGGRWMQRVLFDISEVGYDAEWHCIPASSIGAPHRRDRVWIVAYPNSIGEQSRHSKISGENGEISQRNESTEPNNTSKQSAVLAYSNNNGSSASKIEGGINERGDNIQKGAKPSSKPERLRTSRNNENVAHTECERQSRQGAYGQRISKKAFETWKTSWAESNGQREGWSWLSEPNVGRVADGLPETSHRLKGLGNAVVPQILGRAILECEK